MEKNGLLLVLLFLFMIAFGRSNAVISRKLVMTPDPNGSSNTNQDSLMSSPPEEKKQIPSPVEASEPKNAPTKNPSGVESKGLNDANTTKSSESSDKKVDKRKSEDGKVKVGNQNQSKTFSSISCNGNPICSDQKKTMTACIQDIEDGSKKLRLVMQNEQDIGLNVTIILGTLTKNLSLPGHATEKVNITLSGYKSTKLILNAGNGDCELQIGQTKTTSMEDSSKSKDTNTNTNSKEKDADDTADTPAKPKDVKNPADSPAKPNDTIPGKSKEVNETPGKSKGTVNDRSKPEEADNPLKSTVQNNFHDQVLFYSKQVTPMYGAYFGFLVALVIGGSWALCSFRKRRSEGGVAYQELEMGLPESSDVEPVEGWDADWDDDDWEEDKAIRSPGISSNGLTSRATKKDGWDH